MGLDVLHHGGYASMVSLQRSLILLLSLFPPFVSAAWLNEPDNAIIYTKNTASSLEQASSKLSDVLAACNSQYPQGCQGESGEKYGQYRYVVWYFDPPECEQLNHEPGGTIDESLCGQCSLGYILVDSSYGAPFECMRNREPGECSDLGLAETQTPQGSFCSEECEHGMFNGVCLPPPEPEKECNKDSPDYRGVLVQGYGKPVIPACGDFDQCADGSPGKVGLVNGELRCIADNYGEQNECAADEIFIIDEYGVICAGLDDTPEEQPTPEDPNTDTDGDGQPDEYNPDNDPNINRKQLDDLNQGQDQANKSLGNLEKIGKGTNDRLDDIGKELENNSKGIGEIVGFTRQINEKLDISDNATGPNLPEEGTITASLDRMNSAIFGHPTVDAFTTIPQLPSVTSCPIYTIPATKWTESLTMDMHCIILEENRSILSLIMVAVWSLTAIAVFLRA